MQAFMFKRCIRRLAVFLPAMPLLCSLPLWAQDAVLPTIEVKGSVPAALVPEAEVERATLESTPGGVNWIEPQKTIGSRYTLRDILDHQPGIVLLDFFGGADHPILSVRGSGIQSHPQTRGIMLLENGLPMNDADGAFHIGMVEARDARAILARRGTNALHPAADALGGELEFRSLTGLDETGGIDLQYGSFNTLLTRAAIGGRFGTSDYHLSVSGSRSDGYRDHADQQRTALRANFGTIIGNFENRTWISHTDQEFDIPGPLTRALALHDPTTNINATLPMVRTTDPHRETRQWRLANRSAFRTGEIGHDIGFYYQDTDDTFTSPTTVKASDARTFGLQYALNGKTGALAHEFSIFWARTSADIRYRFNPKNPAAPIRTLRPSQYDAGAKTLNLQWNGDLALSGTFHLTGQLRWVESQRDLRQKTDASTQDERWRWLAPRIGIRWTPVEEATFFVNFSAAREAPTFDQLVRFQSPPPPPASMRLVPLVPQRVRTFEIGGRGRLSEALEWDLALYRARIEKELVEYSPDGITTYTFNYHGTTRHQGIELGLRHVWAMEGGTRLASRVSYTHNDFTFRDGVYRGNRLAGIPRNLLQVESLYARGALEFGPNVRWVIGKTPTDYSNLAQYDGYAVWGLKLRYAPMKDLSFFLQADNLTDKRYIASVSTPAAADANGTHYFPGNGRAFSAGLRYQF
ncbi:MAG: TonB-dependent receptor [Azoarcus sp.]|jgi:iron complex outermembrane receptor protein|nr:TonB-dependent receptor [Azoarcus sp.]